MAADSKKCLWFLVTFLSVTKPVHSTEQGKWTKDLNLTSTSSYVAVYKTLYNRSEVTLSISCGDDSHAKLSVRWMLRWSPCAEEYLGLETDEGRAISYLDAPSFQRLEGYTYPVTEYITSTETVDCNEHFELKTVENFQSEAMTQTDDHANRKREADPTSKSTLAQKTTPKLQTTKAQNASPSTKAPTTAGAPGTTNAPDKSPTVAGKSKHLLCHTWKEGVFAFILELYRLNDSADSKPDAVHIDIKMTSANGYLSAMEWPLLVFYGVMCIVYVILGLIWLVLLACNWRDLLRVQFWIGGVIVLGMLEKAVFYAEFQNINYKGESVPGAIIFAELVSCFKRTVARMLVIIVSLGFGIVKPRLGPMLHKVLGVGSLYFIFAVVEGCFRTVKSKSDQNKNIVLVAIPLALVDAIICWWIFTSLVQTLRTLRLRRNIVKLSLYRHFTNTLVFAVLASIAFMVWSYTQHRLKLCLTDWKELWVDDAYWHLLFSVILIVIMVLWRPTVNNQRYAFSPLLDAADDEADEDVIMSDAFEGMKMRGVRNGSPRQSAASKAEDDLKWVEENIPSTLIDKAIPGVIDSDEEIVTTKLEMAKME